MSAQRFNPAVANLDIPPIPTAVSWTDDYNGSYGPLINLSQAVPNFAPNTNLLQQLASAANSTESTGYGPIEGEDSLREVYADQVANRYKADIQSEHIHITSGCNQAFVATLIALAGHGDNVVMSNPCYFNHEATAQLLGIDIRYADCNADQGFQPTVESIEKVIDASTRAIALVSPNNPTGAIYSEQSLDTLFQLCEKHGIWLILDETYRDFLPTELAVPHSLLSKPNWQQHFIQLYSFSKSLCIPGHRLGAITAGREAVGQIAKVMDNIQICAPRAAQLAVARELPKLSEWTAKNTATIAERSVLFTQTMDAVPEFTIRSQGAYFSYIEHSFKGLSSFDVAKQLAQELGVLALPGSFFGSDQDAYLRFAFANVDSDVIAGIGDRLNSARELLSS